jgi:hypothetical protein
LHIETKVHTGGFWILEAGNLDEALAWAKKAAIVCDVPGEVRELSFLPGPGTGTRRKQIITLATVASEQAPQ